MAAPIVVSLPTAPQRGQPFETFTTNANGWVDALADWTDDVNALGTFVNNTAATVDTDATAASNSADAAALSATSASDDADLAEQYKNEAEAAVATIPEGSINDSITTLTDAWSSQKISNELSGYIPNTDAPTGDIVGTTDSQTLTNKTLSFSGNTLTGVVGTTATQTLTNKTLESPAIDGYSETVHALTGTTPAIDNSNGTIQTWTLTGNSTPTDSLSAGESVTLMIDDGTANTVTWTMVDKWFGGVPELSTTEYTAITLWKVGSTVYGATLPEVE